MGTEATPVPTPAAPAPAAPAETPVVVPVDAAAATPDPKQPAEKTPADPKAPPVSPRFAAVMKQEKSIRDLEAQLKEREAKLSEREKQAEARQKLKAENPLKWLEEEGHSYEKLTQLYLNDGKPSAEDQVSARLKEFEDKAAAREKELDDRVKKIEEREQSLIRQENERIEAKFWADSETALKGAGEKYELVLAHPDGFDTVKAVMREHARQTGKVMPIEEAAAKVQAALDAQVTPVLTSKWAAAKLQPVAPKQASPSAASETGPSRAVRTLSDSHAAPPAPSREPTAAERREAAIRFLEARKTQPT